MAYLLKLPQCCWLKLIASVLADFLQIDAKDFDVVLCEAKLDSANTLLRQCGVLKAFFHSSSQVHYHPWYFDQLHRRKHQPEDYQYFHFRHCYYVYQLCPPFWAETQKGLITFHFSKNMLSFSNCERFQEFLFSFSKKHNCKQTLVNKTGKICTVKFTFSEKATKIDKIFTINLTVCSNRQINDENFQKT